MRCNGDTPRAGLGEQCTAFGCFVSDQHATSRVAGSSRPTQMSDPRSSYSGAICCPDGVCARRIRDRYRHQEPLKGLSAHGAWRLRSSNSEWPSASSGMFWTTTNCAAANVNSSLRVRADLELDSRALGKRRATSRRQLRLRAANFVSARAPGVGEMNSRAATPAAQGAAPELRPLRGEISDDRLAQERLGISRHFLARLLQADARLFLPSGNIAQQ